MSSQTCEERSRHCSLALQALPSRFRNQSVTAWNTLQESLTSGTDVAIPPLAMTTLHINPQGLFENLPLNFLFWRVIFRPVSTYHSFLFVSLSLEVLYALNFIFGNYYSSPTPTNGENDQTSNLLFPEIESRFYSWIVKYLNRQKCIHH